VSGQRADVGGILDRDPRAWGVETVISRRLLLSSALAALAAPALADAPTTSLIPEPRPARGKGGAAGDVTQMIKAADLGGSIGYVVADAKTGEVLESLKPDIPMVPASVTKVLTTLFALDTLGAGYRFRTRLLDVGGTLVLQGGGDPLLNTDHLAELVKRAKAAGLRNAETFQYDDAALPYFHEIDASQAPHLNYNPAISGLNLNFNQVYFEWKREGGDWQVSMDARTDRLRPTVRMAKMAISDRERPVYTYEEADGTEHWTVARAALGKGGSRWLPVRHPGAYTAEVFRTLARAEGIELGDPRPVSAKQGRVLAEWQSAPLTETLDLMMENSINLVAEVLGLTASKAKSLTGSAEIMRLAIAGYGARSAIFGDHSGLSTETRITPREMTEVLSSAAEKGTLRPLMKQVQMKTSKGKVVKDHPVKVAAKSGTLNFVSNLAGYADVPGGRTLAFAIFTGDLDRREKANASGDDIPEGVGGWTKRAKQLQNDLIDRWGKLYAG
jgi:serine-type D-Ala-D-Ala carboxypeptidase/endopeptidase (penicillin-binding protein 4)